MKLIGNNLSLTLQIWQKKFIKLATQLFFVFICLPLLYLLWPFRRIKITHFGIDRLGNTACDMQIYRAQRRMRPEAGVTRILLAGGTPANCVLRDLFARELPLITRRLPSFLWHANKRLIARTRFHAPMFPYSYNDHAETAFDLPAIRFDAEDEGRGQALLAAMGIGPTDWYVCFHARDGGYRKASFPGEGDEACGHVRNIDVSDFLPVAEAVVAAGGFAVRMGAMVEKPLPPGLSPRIIDYATRFRSEFGDIYLPSRARFFIGNASGLAEIPHLFGVPTAVVSSVHLFPLALGRKSLHTTIRLRHRDSGRDLHFEEGRRLGFFDLTPKTMWMDLPQFEAIGLDVLINDRSDIFDLYLDMMEAAQGIPPPPEALRLQEIYTAYNADMTSLAEYGPRLGPRFALKYRHLIE